MRLCYIHDQAFYQGPDERWYAANDFGIDYHVENLPGLTEWHWWARLSRVPDTAGLARVAPAAGGGVGVHVHGPWQEAHSPAGFIRHAPGSLAALRRLVQSCDVVWLRLPFVYSLLAASVVRDDQVVVTQQIGDPAAAVKVLFPAWRWAGPVQASLTVRAHSRADLAVFVSDFLRRRFGRGLPSTLVANESRLTEGDFFGPPARREGRLRIMYVGRFSGEKGVEVLFRAVGGLPGTELLMVGAGPMQGRLEDLARRGGFADRVRWLGYKRYGPELFQTVRQAHVLALPSLTEGLGLVAAEAMSQSVPVVASRAGGIVEVVRDGHNGLLVPPGDPAALAAALERMRDEDLRLALAGNGPAAAGRHTISNQAGRVLRAIAELKPWRRRRLAGPPRPPRRLRLCLVVTAAASIQLLRWQLGDLKARGIDATVISGPGPEQELARAEGAGTITVEMARGINPPADLRGLAGLVGVMSRRRFDVVHVGTPKAALLGSLAARIAGRGPLVCTFHGRVYENEHGPRRRLLAGLDRLICSLADAVVPVSRELGERMVREGICPRRKLRLIGQGSCRGVNLAVFTPSARTAGAAADLRARHGVKPSDLVIVYVGRLTVEKGIRELAGAFYRLAEERPDVHLVCVGGQDARSPLPQAVVNRLAAHPRVHLVEWTYDPAPWYAAADIAVLPSYREGFGLTLIEAAAMHLPTIGADVIGVREAVEDGVTGLLVRPGSAADLLEGMRRLADDPDLRGRLARAGRRRVERGFDSREISAALAGLYRRLARARPAEGI